MAKFLTKVGLVEKTNDPQFEEQLRFVTSDWIAPFFYSYTDGLFLQALSDDGKGC